VEVLDAPAALSAVPGARSASPLFAQLWPHRHGTDAIFIALLRRGRHGAERETHQERFGP
jgi:16S rRNA (cytosine967-C5)-methyltransferase